MAGRRRQFVTAKDQGHNMPFYAKPTQPTTAEIMEQARASLAQPSRPFTPAVGGRANNDMEFIRGGNVDKGISLKRQGSMGRAAFLADLEASSAYPTRQGTANSLRARHSDVGTEYVRPSPLVPKPPDRHGSGRKQRGATGVDPMRGPNNSSGSRDSIDSYRPAPDSGSIGHKPVVPPSSGKPMRPTGVRRNLLRRPSDANDLKASPPSISEEAIYEGDYQVPIQQRGHSAIERNAEDARYHQTISERQEERLLKSLELTVTELCEDLVPDCHIVDLRATAETLLNCTYDQEYESLGTDFFSLVVRSCIRLMDLKDACLLLRLCKIILRTTNSSRTMTNCFKMMHKLSGDNRNDVTFQEENVFDELLAALTGRLDHFDAHTETEGRASVAGTLKNLTMNIELMSMGYNEGGFAGSERSKNTSLARMNVADVIDGVYYVLESALQRVAAEIPWSYYEMTAVLHAFGIYRNLITLIDVNENSTRVQLQHLVCREDLMAVIGQFISYLPGATMKEAVDRNVDVYIMGIRELVLQVARIMGKITVWRRAIPLLYGGQVNRQVVIGDEDRELDDRCSTQAQEFLREILSSIFQMTVTHKEHYPCATRLLFVLGNLTAHAVDSGLFDALYFVDGPEQLLDLFDFYLMTDPEVAALLAADGSRKRPGPGLTGTYKNEGPVETAQTGAGAPQTECEDLLVKMVRVLTNLAISPEFGPELAKAQPVGGVVSILAVKSLQCSEEMILNAVAFMHNLSYYYVEGLSITAGHLGEADENQMIKVCKLLHPILLCDNIEAVMETVRVFSNFARLQCVRAYINKSGVDRILTILLDAENLDLCAATCGALMNLMGQREHRWILKEYGGPSALIDLISFAPERLGVATTACKVLFNYCSAALEEADDNDIGQAISYEEFCLLTQTIEQNVSIMLRMLQSQNHSTENLDDDEEEGRQSPSAAKPAFHPAAMEDFVNVARRLGTIMATSAIEPTC
eukprot:Clim_evm19s215 gene=Clim_evmTU19s215